MSEYKNELDDLNRLDLKDALKTEFDDKIEIQHFNFNKVQIPQFIEKADPTKKWIQWGLDNQFPQYLQSLLTKSSLHASITSSKARMIGGHGWLKTNLDLKTMLFLKNSKSNFDLDEILYKVAIDMEVYGGFALECIWSKDRESISEINYVDFAKVRVQAPDKKNKYPQILNYWISQNWAKTRENCPELYQGFSTRAKRNRHQILYVKHYQAGTEFYPRVEYLPAIRDMETDWLIRDWTMHSVLNGYTPGYIITIPGVGSSPEQRRSVANRIRSDFAGTSNANVGYIQFTNNTNEAPKFEPIELNNSDDRYMLTDEMIERSILKSHAVKNPKLYGAGTEGGITIGASKNEMIEAVEIFQNDYAVLKQNIIEKVFNRLARINGVTDNLIIKRYSDSYRKIDTNLEDIIKVLTAQTKEAMLPISQQYWVLVQNGYTHEIASKLTGYDGGNSLADNADNKTQTTPLLPQKHFEDVWEELKFMSVDRSVNKFEFEKYCHKYFEKKDNTYFSFSKSKELKFDPIPEETLSDIELENEEQLEAEIEFYKNETSWNE